MFKNLQENLNEVFKKLSGKGKISEKNIADAIREIRLALLEADVEVETAKEIIDAIKAESIGQKVIRSVQPGEQIVKIFQDELTKILGEQYKGLDLNKPARILIIGLNGAGKTTTAGKLALFLKKQGRTPHIVPCDMYRPAAVKQLETLAEQIELPCFVGNDGETSPINQVKLANKWLAKQNAKIAIYDTAGRQEVDGNLLDELVKLKKLIDPTDIFLVADSATGQQAVNVAQTFNQAVGISGIILTKLDGDARGGAALSMHKVTGKPIAFIGVGEKLEQLETFDPERITGRILGMGDIVGLVESASQAIEEREAMRLAKRMERAEFDFNDFLTQIKMMKKMGSIGNIMEMMPGMGNIKMPDASESEKRMKRTEAIILSMTKKERSKPVLIKGSRKKRIAQGSGTSMAEVNQIIRQFSMMRNLFKNKGKLNRMMSAFGGGMGGLGGLGKLGDMEGGEPEDLGELEDIAKMTKPNKLASGIKIGKKRKFKKRDTSMPF